MHTRPVCAGELDVFVEAARDPGHYREVEQYLETCSPQARCALSGASSPKKNKKTVRSGVSHSGRCQAWRSPSPSCCSMSPGMVTTSALERASSETSLKRRALLGQKRSSTS